ncbi:MAG: flippase [bacterium]|nr:flippase [bacterium]
MSLQTLFFENLSPKQTVLKNSFWLAVAEGVSRLLKLILIIYVARVLGATEYGKFNFALAFVALFAIFADLGLSSITTRELSRDKEREKEFSSLFSLKIILSLGTLILILIGSFFISPDSLLRKVIWILALYTLISSFSEIVYAFFRARQKMEYEALTKILQAVLVTVVGFFVILNFPSIQNLSFSYLLASVAALIFILFFFHFKVYPLSLSWDKTIWKNFLAMSWPLALAGIFGTIYSQTDSVMMGYWGQITQTGWYNAAYKIIGVTLIPAGLISTSFFPAFSLAFKESKERLQKIWDYFMNVMVILAVPLVVGGFILAPRIIDVVYDPNYFPAIFAFQILILMAGISFLANPFGQILIVANQQKKLFWVIFYGALLNVILNLILIPKYSLYGAALATVIASALVFFLLSYFTIKLRLFQPFDLKFFSNFFGALLTSLPMYFVITQPRIYHLNVFLSIFIGAGVYLICFLLYKRIVGKFSPS